MTSAPPSRRTVLKTSGAFLASGGLAGCLSNPLRHVGELDELTVEVGPENIPKFDPDRVSVDPETTVTWVWRSHNHNIVVDDIPQDASWDGTPGDSTIAYGPDYTYEHSFSVAGTYSYYCQPHLPGGMTGTVVVE